MVMADKSFPQMLGDDIRALFSKKDYALDDGGPGSEQPAPGKCGCHPGGMHPQDAPMEVEQRDPVELVAIPVKVENIASVRILPAKRASMETFYPGTNPATSVMIQGKDPRIKRLVISVSTQACWIGTLKQIQSMTAGGNGVTNSQGFLVAPNNIPPHWEGIDEDLWAMAMNGGSILSVRREYWTDI